MWKLLNLAKAELLQVGNFFALNFLPWEVLLMKKLEIDKAKPTCYISFKRCILVGLSLLDFQLFYEKKRFPGKEIESGLAAVIQLYVIKTYH